jgi:hypothetical protein
MPIATAPRVAAYRLKYIVALICGLAMAKPKEIRVFRVEPKVISVRDYSNGFGHTDLVTV